MKANNGGTENSNCMNRNFCIIILSLVFSAAVAQESADSLAAKNPSISPLTIQANVESARVFLDADSVGVTPLTIPAVTPGYHCVKIVPPNAESWLSEPIVDSILVQPRTAQTLHYSFTQKTLILSSPSGAEVFLKDSLVGTTPLVIKTVFPSFKLKKQGFEEADIEIASAKSGIVSTQLKKVWLSGAEESIFRDSEENGSSLRLYITGATTILAGAASAYFKVRADNSYSQYVRSGDPSQLSEVNRLDTAAGIALVATQMSLGLFTYFILSE